MFLLFIKVSLANQQHRYWPTWPLQSSPPQTTVLNLWVAKAFFSQILASKGATQQEESAKRPKVCCKLTVHIQAVADNDSRLADCQRYICFQNKLYRTWIQESWHVSGPTDSDITKPSCFITILVLP